MSDRNFHLNLPEEIIGAFGWQDSEVPIRVREALVMDLLRLDRISEAQAAKLLQVPRWQLLEIMGRFDVPAVRMTVEDLDRELATPIKRDGS